MSTIGHYCGEYAVVMPCPRPPTDVLLSCMRAGGRIEGAEGGLNCSKLTPYPSPIKSRLMNITSNQSTFHVLKESILHEGPRVLFRGWLPACARLQPTTILTFFVLEQLRRVVDLSRDINNEV